MMRIYLSGAVSGDPAYAEKFSRAATALRERYPGADVVNPILLVSDVDAIWQAMDLEASPCDYLLADLEELRNCTHIVRIADGIPSAGADIEIAFAKYAGIQILPDAEASS